MERSEAQTPPAWPALSSLWNDWPIWWKNRTLFQRVFPAAAIGAYWLSIWLLGGWRTDHLTTGIFILALSYGGRLLNLFLKFALPFLLTAIIYDSQRFFAEYIRGRIHVSEPYEFDKRFFGITTAQGVLTPNEWFQLHLHPALDLITGFAYLVFIAAFILIAGYFWFYASRKGTPKVPAAEMARKASRVNWSFLWVNLIGYSTYYWYAAAPPWYVAMYGLGPARLDVAANAAGCARFDQILGTHFFSEMYGRAADVFGAIPSLHVAYPFLAVLFSFQFGALRLTSILFYAVMCFSAVYLNHHYILDILWGTGYAILTWLLINWLGDRNQANAEARAEAHRA